MVDLRHLYIVALLVCGGCESQSGETVFNLKSCDSRMDAERCDDSCRDTSFQVKVTVNADTQVVLVSYRTKNTGVNFPSPIAAGECKIVGVEQWVCEDEDKNAISLMTEHLTQSGDKLVHYKSSVWQTEQGFERSASYDCAVRAGLL